ncbi:MAG: LTA synthase family protein [Ruminococcaceae bacterium]|nr:LTA synthase family protein [Oscillospiraceae bacterium]
MKRDEIILKKTDSVWSLFGVSLCLILMFIKSVVFYGGLNLGSYDLTFSFATVGILLAVYLAVYPFSRRGAKAVLFTLYALAGLLMSIDSVYYGYVAKMPSVAQLGMAGQLDDVAETIQSLIGWEEMLPILDLPLWFLYAVNRKSDPPLPRVPKKGVLAAGGGVCALVLAVIVLTPGFKGRYMTNELFCYHVRDIAVTISSPIAEREVDKSLYTAEAESDSEYFGIARGRNLIVIQVEAMQNFVIGAEYNGQTVTPNLNALIGGDSFYFSNYYYQIGGGNTADAEFAVNNSLFGPENEAGYVKYTDNDYNGLPFLLKQNGYSGAYAFHGYHGNFWNRENAYPNQGFDDFISLEDLEKTDMFPMGLSDRELFRQSIDCLVTYEEPFYAFYVTVSSHHPYAIPEGERAISLLPEDEGTLFGNYIQAMNYADTVLGEFIAMLTEAGIYENSVIAIYGDHYALTNTDHGIAHQFLEMTGRTYTIFDVFNVPFIINVPGMGRAETVETPGGHIDVMPTLLCTLGLTNDRTVMFGQNLLTAEEGIVCQQTHLAQGSFISEDIFFSKPQNNIESQYSVYRREDMATLPPTEYSDLSEYALNSIRDCEALLARNDIFLDGSIS